jgi:hypothetical protein
MIEQLGRSLSIFRAYESLFEESDMVQSILAIVYYDVLVFLKKARFVFMARGVFLSIILQRVKGPNKAIQGSRIFLRGILRGFDQDFQTTLAAVDEHSRALHDAITLAHRQKMHKFMATQLDEQRICQHSVPLQVSFEPNTLSACLEHALFGALHC